jgi:hypothetical protein
MNSAGKFKRSKKVQPSEHSKPLIPFKKGAINSIIGLICISVFNYKKVLVGKKIK